MLTSTFDLFSHYYVQVFIGRILFKQRKNATIPWHIPLCKHFDNESMLTFPVSPTRIATVNRINKLPLSISYDLICLISFTDIGKK